MDHDTCLYEVGEPWVTSRCRFREKTCCLKKGLTGFFFNLLFLLCTPRNRAIGHKVYASDAKTAGIVCRQSAGLVIERLRVRVSAGTEGEGSSPEITFCADSYSVSAPPHVTTLRQWHVKDPGHSAKRAGGRLHLNTHTP